MTNATLKIINVYPVTKALQRSLNRVESVTEGLREKHLDMRNNIKEKKL